MADPAFNILSLCSGYGGLDLGVELAIGPAARVVCGVEREAACCGVLAAAMGTGLVAPFPVWSDLRTFDGRPWRGVVDCVTGGYPCQPFSFAGKRRGADDPRHLWPAIARIVAEVEPGIVFFENVAGHVTLGFPAVRRELEGMGYRVTAGLFTAEEVGAPHKRERLFILGVREMEHAGRDGVGGPRLCESEQAGAASGNRGGVLADRDEPAEYLAQADGRGGSAGPACTSGGELADSERAGSWRGEQGEQGEASELGRDRLADCGDGMADAGRSVLQGRERAGALCEQRPPAPGSTGEGGGAVADTACDDGRVHARRRTDGVGTSKPDRSGGSVVGNAAIGGIGRSRVGAGEKANSQREADHHDAHRSGVPLFPPGPGSRDWPRILAARPDLAPATQPRVRGVDDGRPGRLDQLRLLGNGVVPLVAAYAFCTLWACLREDC